MSAARAAPSIRLSSGQLARVDTLLDELLELPAEKRYPVLDIRCTDDCAVHAEVGSLLSAVGAVGNFLSTPATLAPEPQSADFLPGTRFAAWRILRRIGRGGMGVVYEAERAEGDFQQRVAIKVLREEAIAELPRFHIERQILAQLEHPGIARLYDGGLAADKRPYMVMEFVEGRPITEYCVTHCCTLEQRMQLFMQVCDAVAYAHRNLIVHRDLKPANILVTTGGQVKLLDFGIAKLIDADRPDMTLASAPLTPLTAAPEQLTGQPVTTATDIYALGLLLFELLTDTPPWLRTGGPIAQAVRVILDEPPPVPSRRAAEIEKAPFPSRSLRGDFDSVVAKAARKEPQHRYPTVEALRADIDDVLRGGPVAARSGAKLYVFGRIMRRYRWVAAAVAAVLVSLTIGLGAAAWQARRAAIERNVALRDAAREEAVRYQLTRLFHAAIEQRGSQPATAKGMIDDSALRVLREYRSQPQLQGQIVLTLADLYGALQDMEGSAALLGGFIQQAGPATDPAALADARQKLAYVEVQRGHTERAVLLSSQAETFWNQHPGRYAEERLEGLAVKARVQRASGELEAAIGTETAAIAQRIALSGRIHRETAVLYHTHAITLTAASRLNEALAADREALQIYQGLGLGGELDSQIIIGNMGTVEFRTGHLRTAEGLLRTAYQRERALAGDSAAVAWVMGFYGEALTLTGRSTQALPIARESVDLATRYAGAASPVALQNLLYLADAESATGAVQAARATLVSDREAAAAQYGPKHLATLRARMLLARFDFEHGSSTSERAELVAIIGQLRELGARGDALLAQALQCLGELELAARKPTEATAILRQAVSILDRFAPSGWALASARERLGEALGGLRQPGAAAAQLNAAIPVLSAELGLDNEETVRAMRALQALDRATPGL